MLRKILEHKITFAISAIAFVIVAAGSAYFLLSPQKQTLTGVAAKVMTVSQTISASGNVDSDSHVTLAFQKDGIVTAVNVKVGDPVRAGETLAVMDNGSLTASLLGARADVQSAAANVTALEKGATPQTLAVSAQNVSTAKIALSTTVRDAFLKVQDALLTKMSILFQNNSSPNPTLTFNTDSYQTGLAITNARADLTTRMAAWSALLGASTTSDAILTEASNDIAAAKNLTALLTTAVNRLASGGSGTAQNVIDADVAAVTGSAAEVNAADTELDAALQAYRTSTDQLAVVSASSTPENLQIAEAALAKASANVASIQSQIDDTVLTAPFDGVVASVNPKAGENFSANDPAIDVVSQGAYKIDIMIPENEVAAVSVGDQADIHFDALGADLAATGTISSIDLSETMTDGVGAYKTTVILGSSNPNIRTGMTATVDIEGATAENVVAIPASAVITKDNASYALVLDQKGDYTQQPIVTGISDGSWTEVKSGIQPGQTVATFGDTSI